MSREIPLGVKLGAAALGIGGVAFGVGYSAGEHNAYEQYADQAHTLLVPSATPEPTPFLPPIECKTSDLQNELLSNASNPDITPVLSSYSSAQYFYESIGSNIVGSDGQIFLNGNPEGIAEVKKKAMDHVANGLCLVEGIPSIADKFTTNGNTVTYLENIYDLTNTADFNIVAGLIKLELIRSKDNEDAKSQKDIDALLSLRDVPFTLGIESEAFPIIATEHLVSLSNMQHFMERIGLPPVDHIEFKGFRPGDPGGAWYERDDLTQESKITITNHSTPEATMKHEFGHHVARINDERDNHKGVELFGEIYKSTRRHLGLTNSYSTVHQTDGSFTINPVEEYAEAFRKYIDGTLTGSYSSITDKALAEMELSFFRFVLSGLEFSNGYEFTRVNESEIREGNYYSLITPEHSQSVRLYETGFETDKPYVEFYASLPAKYIVIGEPKKIETSPGHEVTMWQIGHTQTEDGKPYPMGWIEPSALVTTK